LLGVVERHVMLSKRSFLRAKRWLSEMAARRGFERDSLHPYDGLYAFLSPGVAQSLVNFLENEPIDSGY
jgi:hypothetical protein